MFHTYMYIYTCTYYSQRSDWRSGHRDTCTYNQRTSSGRKTRTVTSSSSSSNNVINPDNPDSPNNPLIKPKLNKQHVEKSINVYHPKDSINLKKSINNASESENNIHPSSLKPPHNHDNSRLILNNINVEKMNKDLISTHDNLHNEALNTYDTHLTCNTMTRDNPEHPSPNDSNISNSSDNPNDPNSHTSDHGGGSKTKTSSNSHTTPTVPHANINHSTTLPASSSPSPSPSLSSSASLDKSPGHTCEQHIKNYIDKSTKFLKMYSKFYVPPSLSDLKPQNQGKGLIIVFGWWGSTQAQLSHYSSFLIKHDYSCITVTFPTYVLMNPWSRKQIAREMNDLIIFKNKNKKVCLYMFSNGGALIVEDMLRLAVSARSTNYNYPPNQVSNSLTEPPHTDQTFLKTPISHHPNTESSVMNTNSNFNFSSNSNSNSNFNNNKKKKNHLAINISSLIFDSCPGNLSIQITLKAFLSVLKHFKSPSISPIVHNFFLIILKIIAGGWSIKILRTLVSKMNQIFRSLTTIYKRTFQSFNIHNKKIIMLTFLRKMFIFMFWREWKLLMIILGLIYVYLQNRRARDLEQCWMSIFQNTKPFPALFLFSNNDHLVPAQDILNLIQSRKNMIDLSDDKRNLQVTELKHHHFKIENVARIEHFQSHLARNYDNNENENSSGPFSDLQDNSTSHHQWILTTVVQFYHSLHVGHFKQHRKDYMKYVLQFLDQL